MATPKVSVCIPTYEPDSGLLHEAIRSVLAQTETNWELLVHDDCSKADVRGMIDVFLSDPRVKFIRSPDRLGIGRNWNTTAKATQAPVVAYLFQDDVWHPRYLSRALEAMMKHPSVGLVALQHGYDIRINDETTDLYRKLFGERKLVFKRGFAEGTPFLHDWLRKCLHPNIVGEPDFVVVTRETLERAGWWDERMVQCLDLEGWTRMLQHTDIAFVEEESGSFRVHDAATSARNQREGRGLTERLQTIIRLLLHGKGSVKFSAFLAATAASPTMAWKLLRRVIRTLP